MTIIGRRRIFSGRSRIHPCLRAHNADSLVKSIPLELMFWIGGLVYLALIDPFSDSTPSLCLFEAIGFGSCPGCGLGESISRLFHADMAGSVQAHVLGLPALSIILARIAQLTRQAITIHRKDNTHG
jgi:hypothetical protein